MLAAEIAVTSVDGWNAGAEVIGGKWTGQPPTAPTRGKYFGYYAVDADPIYGSYWTIHGIGFGTRGMVTIPNSPSIWVVRTIWTPTKLTVYVGSSYNFTAAQNVSLTIMPADTTIKPLTFTVPAVGTIKSRGYGQCTWFVAKTRHAQSRAIPPTAYVTTALIDAQYQPAQWDVINFTTSHTSIIVTPVTELPAISQPDGSKIVTYQFKIGEMNVKPPWGEQDTSIASSFVVSIGKTGAKTVVTGILSDYSQKKTATGYYR